ncbi:hypothetical protein NECAME_19240, partial [Necator americanus]
VPMVATAAMEEDHGEAIDRTIDHLPTTVDTGRMVDTGHMDLTTD